MAEFIEILLNIFSQNISQNVTNWISFEIVLKWTLNSLVVYVMHSIILNNLKNLINVEDIKDSEDI